jgi:MFS family permease
VRERWPAARQARYAVAVLFFANGALFANLVPRLPDLKANLELSNAAFGSAIAAYVLGALVVGLAGSLLVRRWGSNRVAPLSTIGLAANLVLVAVAPSWLALAVAFLIAGSLDVVADISGNVHGLRVERLYGQSILNSQHGVWSIGAVVGGSMGAAAAGLGVPVAWHLAVVAGLFAALAVGAWRFLLPGRDDTERTASAHSGSLRPSAAARLRLIRGLVALGLIAAMAQVMEDAGGAWGALYLGGELGAAAGVSGLGFIALQALQTVGRLAGDGLVTRYGDRAVARAGATLAGLAMAAALAVPSVLATVVAFGVVGLGIGTLIPASLRTADDLPGLGGGAGITIVGSVNRIAVLAVPPLIGLVADAYSLRAALLVMPVAAVAVLLLSPALRGPGALRHQAGSARDPAGRPQDPAGGPRDPNRLTR